jgi:tRNA A-37 threonylcarbamoyl transferase component Bud32
VIEKMSSRDKELKKGNMSEVYRDGDIVYRDIKPQSKTISRLLLHLEKKGIQFTPRFLGTKDVNQEMLSFVEGETIEDYPTQNDIQSKMMTVQLAAKMLREYHDATLDFERRDEDIWFLNYEGNLQKEVICHNDFAPYNVTFKHNKPIGLIDFDTACPAPRIWDVAYAVYRFVPLSMEVFDPDANKYRKYDKTLDCSERALLLRTFLDAYGSGIEDVTGILEVKVIDVLDVLEVLQNVIMRLEALVKLFDEECSKGNVAFIKMQEEGHQQLYIDEITFIRENMEDWI